MPCGGIFYNRRLRCLALRAAFDDKDPVKMAERIIESTEKNPAPLRMVLGLQALAATVERLTERLSDYKMQTELAASTDFPEGE